MQIKRTKPEDAKTERYIITSMIVSDDVCRSIKNVYKPEYFQTKMSREVSRWCMDFFIDYDSSPKQDIQSIYEMKTKAGKIDPDLGDEIEILLSSISEEFVEWEDFNIQYYVDLAKKYFKKRSFIILSEHLKEAAENEDIAEAERYYSEFTKVQEQQDKARIITSEEGVETFRISQESTPPHLFTLPGPLGKMIGPIERESLIGLLGREKAGKTYHLQIFAEAAAKQGLKVAFIQTGDLTQDQLDNRIACSRTGKVSKEEKTGVYFVPVLDCLMNQKGRCSETEAEPVVMSDEKGQDSYIVDVKDHDVLRGHEPCTECYKDRLRRHKFKGSVWWQEKDIGAWTWGEFKRKTKKFKKWFRGEIITEAFPMRSIKMSDVREWIITKQKTYGWVPDLVIIDYPDIMLPEDDRKEHRHSENEKWMIARRISEEFHNCVLLATQADAKAYNRDTLKLDNYSESKTKYAHTTHFFAINKTEAEGSMQVSRLAALLLRESGAEISQQVTILSHLDYWRPYVASFSGRMPRIS